MNNNSYDNDDDAILLLRLIVHNDDDEKIKILQLLSVGGNDFTCSNGFTPIQQYIYCKIFAG